MNQANVGPLIPKLKMVVRPRRKLSSPEGPWGRINKLRKTVTALVQYERLELHHHRCDEARGYAERLISEAVRNGDTHEATMELADFWLLNKQLVHKLFKVLVPRYENHQYAYTRMYRGPLMYPKIDDMAILELVGNPFPTLRQKLNNKLMLHNVLLDAARYDYKQQKFQETVRNVSDETDPPLVVDEKPESS